MNKTLINPGDSVPFNELPEDLDFGVVGTVTYINPASNIVLVRVPRWPVEVAFELDGSSWSLCGSFKRDISFVD